MDNSAGLSNVDRQNLVQALRGGLTQVKRMKPVVPDEGIVIGVRD